MALGTLPGLKTGLADLLNRPDISSEALSNFVTLAESQMNRRLRCRKMVSRFYAAVPASSEFVALPDDFIGPLDMMTGGDPMRRLKYLEPDSLANVKAANRFCGGECTKYYSIVGNTLRFLPLPPSDMTVELVYWARVPALTDAAPTNWVLTDHPDVYLYGSAIQACIYLKTDPSTFGTLFLQAISDVNDNDPVPSDAAALRTEVTVCGLGLNGRYGFYSPNFDC